MGHFDYSPYNLYYSTNLPTDISQQNQEKLSPYQLKKTERVFPPAQPHSLINSAKNTKLLLADVEIVNEKIRTSPDFAQQLTTAAQKSDHQTVHYLINRLPIKNKALVSFSPGGISITFVHKANDCCYIVVFLNWTEFF